MIKIIFLLLLSQVAFGQSYMDEFRWYLNPNGQNILISIDDLHDENIIATPAMNWGRETVPGLTLKKDILVAVIDGGIEIEHPELKDSIAYNEAECFEGRIIPPKDGEDKDKNGYKGDCAGWDFVENSNRPEDQDGHGTHVTGIIHSVINGVHGNVKFLPLRVFAPDEGHVSVKAAGPLSTRLQKAFEYALSRNVDVIHMSVGWPKSFMTYELEQVIKKVLDKGVIIVSAAGNSSQRATIYPCQMEGVICVGALRPDGQIARFSNWGSQVDILAPGEKILSTIPYTISPVHISRKGYDYKNGTSQAAPFISGALAILKGSFPDESRDTLYARLMMSANSGSNDSSLRGLFHLDRALKIEASSFIFPQTKGLYAVVLDANKEFELKISFKNYWLGDAKATSVSLTCDSATLSPAQNLPGLASLQTDSLLFAGKLNKDVNEMACSVNFGAQTVSLKLKVQEKLRTPIETVAVKQVELLVINTRSGARSRFLTINPIGDAEPAPLYYITGAKNQVIYNKDRVLGALTFPEGCVFLRVWQTEFNQDGSPDLMVETMCDKTYLRYQFLDQKFADVFPPVTFKPSLTIVNYEDFEVLIQKATPPVFRFMNTGLIPPPDSPWDSNVTFRATHLYDLRPVMDGKNWKFEIVVKENTKEWQKSLGLRYLPAYRILHRINDKLLVKIGQKTAWVNILTQKAEWANLDDVLLLGSKKQKLQGTEESVLQSFLTPYEYRGYVMNGIKLRFTQTDVFDPLLDVLGTVKNDIGYQTVLRSFQSLHYLQYDETGILLSRKSSLVDRFDFLTAQELVASVINLSHNGRMIQVVDGTKVNTNYIDVMTESGKTSFEIPASCVTQQPVVLEGKLAMPVFCAKTKSEFEMRFLPL